jgi:hypothetical protein
VIRYQTARNIEALRKEIRQLKKGNTMKPKRTIHYEIWVRWHFSTPERFWDTAYNLAEAEAMRDWLEDSHKVTARIEKVATVKEGVE